jgi:hypothetical protein
MQRRIKYNCSEQDFRNLKKEKTFEGTTNLVLYSKILPFDTILDAMQKSSFINPVAILTKNIKFLTWLEAQWELYLWTPFFANYSNLSKQNKEVGEYLASVNPVGKDPNLSFFIKKFNLSEKLINRSITLNPNFPPNPASLIELDSHNDMKFEKATLTC